MHYYVNPKQHLFTIVESEGGWRVRRAAQVDILAGSWRIAAPGGSVHSARARSTAEACVVRGWVTCGKGNFVPGNRC